MQIKFVSNSFLIDAESLAPECKDQMYRYIFIDVPTSDLKYRDTVAVLVKRLQHYTYPGIYKIWQ